MDLGDSRVVVPLSYGDTRYREVVIGAGRRLFGDRFRPLVGFLPLEDYRTVMSQCGHVVMNQCRQQALGNIFDALWRGARVYMNDTTAYTALTRLGFEVGLVVRELPAGCNLRQLSPPSIQRNRELLQEHLSFDHVVDRTGQLLDVLRSGRPRAA
jgi:dTDP-N-acetylfucosamine:lipid II N-acetylfucosaminyltransferase